MAFSHPIHAGSIDDNDSYVRTMRGCTQFDITIQHKRIAGTVFGDQYLPMVETYREELLRSHRDGSARNPHAMRELLDLICRYCSPILEDLSPQAQCEGYTMEDLVRSPNYALEIVATDDGRDTHIVGRDECSYSPAFDICPLKIAELPTGCGVLERIRARDVLVNVDNEPRLGSTQGRVTIAGGRSLYLKPREWAREKDLDRELSILAKIKRLGLVEGQIKLPELHGIVVTGQGKEEEFVGLLVNMIPTTPTTITDGSMLNPLCWTQHEAHRKWEMQVRAAVEKLHAHEIVWGDVNPGNVMIDDRSDAWVIDFGGKNNPEFVDDDKTETLEGDWQGVERLFGVWLPSRRFLNSQRLMR